LNVVVPQLKVTLGTGVIAAGLKLLGVYPNPPAEHDAGIPLAWSAQPKSSAAPAPVQAVHDRSLCPAACTHLPLLHAPSLVQ
jgi:hypothetical protein